MRPWKMTPLLGSEKKKATVRLRGACFYVFLKKCVIDCDSILVRLVRLFFLVGFGIRVFPCMGLQDLAINTVYI